MVYCIANGMLYFTSLYLNTLRLIDMIHFISTLLDNLREKYASLLLAIPYIYITTHSLSRDFRTKHATMAYSMFLVLILLLSERNAFV